METVVLVLTDVQGSTRLWQDEPVAMDAPTDPEHARELLATVAARRGDWVLPFDMFGHGQDG